LVGWEVVENFFYPHLISVAIYFCVLNWIIQTHPSSIRIAVVTSILTPIIYLVQPIGGVYLSATVLAIFAVDIFRAILHRQMNRAAFIGGFIVLACTLASLRIPQVRALMSYASNDGWLYFNIPDNSFWILFMGFAAFSVLNLMLSMRRLPDRILGAAGSAALMLMIIQDLALTIFHQGSFYAVKKQGFMVLTLGAVNAARLLARYAPAWKSEYVRLIVPCTALLTTCVALWGPGFDLDPIIKAQNAGNALASQAPAKTVADISKYSTFNMLVTVTAFRGSMEELYHGVTKQLTESAPFLFVRQSLRDQACTVIIEKGFAIIRQPCPAGVSTATP
jgi:hypothetical protein